MNIAFNKDVIDVDFLGAAFVNCTVITRNVDSCVKKRQTSNDKQFLISRRLISLYSRLVYQQNLFVPYHFQM